MANVLVPLANGCEELEAVTIIDLLRRAEISVVTAGLEEGSVKASKGVVLLPDTTLDEALKQEYDMVVLPGGLPGSDYLDQDSRIQLLIKNMINNGKYVAAICAAPKVLARAGLLENKSVTSYPGVLDEFNLPNTNDTGDAITIDGQIITSRGPGTAMDFALTLIEELVGKEKRDSVEAALVR